MAIEPFIEKLTEMTDPEAGDYVTAVDDDAPAGDKDRRLDIGRLAILAQANTFLAANTFEAATTFDGAVDLNGALDAKLQGINDSHAFRGAAGQVAPLVDIINPGTAPFLRAANVFRPVILRPPSDLSSGQIWRVEVGGVTSFMHMLSVDMTVAAAPAGSAQWVSVREARSAHRGGSSMTALGTFTIYSSVSTASYAFSLQTNGFRYDITAGSAGLAVSRSYMLLLIITSQGGTVTSTIV